MTETAFHPWNSAHRADPHSPWNVARLHHGVPSAIGPVTGRRFWFPLRHEDCLDDLADRRRPDPGDDLITHLLTVEDEGERLDHQEFLAMVFLLLVGGHETTANPIGDSELRCTSDFFRRGVASLPVRSSMA